MTESRKEQQTFCVETLVHAIGYSFKDPTLLSTALTHRSSYDKNVAHLHGINNERLEFLGDAVLSLVCANFLYQQNSYFSEGDLSRLRALYVCQDHLAQAARSLDLARFIKSDKAMRASGSTSSKAVLSDAMEAIIGAVFIDGGIDAAQRVVLHILGEPPTKLAEMEKDAKTRLQEIIQASIHDAPQYVVLESSGPPHAPTFLVGVKINDAIVATATGENKRVAAQNAAVIALEKYTGDQRQDLL